ncbi:hypothetical protein SAMN04488063_1464 [Halopelagius inordinatus]|uniref:Uncharacterized protein n=1 Tax=Halopelagius inordinatus TaxID=553467 RepID=A0A1I2P5P5_9EURY|nr:hypothetical protein SAMN04488063_1464 [Halopelagius inordinatus]
MLPPSTLPDFALSGTALAAATLWFLRRRGSPLRGISTLGTLVALLGVVALLLFTLLRFGYVDAVLSPSSGLNYGPFWRVLPAIAAEGLSVVLLFVTLTKGLSRPAKQTW